MPDFKWDDKALVPEEVVANFPMPDGKKEKVNFYEFPRLTLVEFVTESLEKKFIEVDPETGQPKKDESGAIKRTPFGEVAEEQAELLFKYLSKACREAQSPEWFAELQLTSKGIHALVDMLLKINHLDEVMATGGNWLMLPTVREMLSEAVSEESVSQKPILEAS